MKTRKQSNVIKEILNKIDKEIEEKAKRAYPDELLKYYCEDTLDLFREAYIKGYKEGFRVGGNKIYDWIVENNSEDHFVKVNEKAEPGYVDLGLPSGTLWATCNAGANKPEEYGDYYNWDEAMKLGITLPTKEQIEELYKECSHCWTTMNGVKGCLFKATNGNTLFLPPAGIYYRGSYYYTGCDGCYLSDTLSENDIYFAYSMELNSNTLDLEYINCYYNKLSVRAVKNKEE